MKTYNLFFLVIACVFSGSCFAQSKVVAAVDPNHAKETVSIDVVDTYERIMDKGYKSPDMLRKVGDRHYFGGNLTLAAKWYSELFNATTDLEAVYYFRYGQSLLAIGEVEKGNEMIKIFKSKNL